MTVGYLVRRLFVFFIVLWLAATVNFLIPRISPVNPIRERLLQAVGQGGVSLAPMEEMVKSYEARFGLDKPMYVQYVNYMSDLFHLDFGYSITRFPNRVSDMILKALPWTLFLITVSTLLSFAVGTLLGALLAWSKSPRWIYWISPPLLTLSAIPYYLLGLVLIFFFAFLLKWFPLGGGYSLGTLPSMSLRFVQDALSHSVLPAASIILSGCGFWALSMRGMMVTTQGEDYMTLAEAKGLSDRRIFLRYGIRNAILPQTTSLALSLGYVVSGSVLVEVVFGYPGVGSLLWQAVRTFDYFIIYGVTFMIIVAIGLATLILDLVYPLLDPRISYQKS